MTPLILQLLKSAAVVVGAGIVLRRFSRREYPALMLWMLWEVMLQTATFGYRDLPAAMMIAQDGICAAVICEVIRTSRLTVQIGTQIRVFVAVIAGAKILSTVPHLTEIQSAYLFRSYFLWAAAVVLLTITLIRWWRPVLERKADRIYRVGTTAWIFCLAVAGSFVKGGIGYQLFPRTMGTWQAVHAATCIVVSGTVLAMSAAMYLSVPGRKRAAKTPKGKTKTGLIEMERAA